MHTRAGLPANAQLPDRTIGIRSVIRLLPFSPVGFSAEIERVSADDKRGRLPRPLPSPLKFDIVFATQLFAESHFIRNDPIIIGRKPF